jgi:hypothetical protein
VKQYTPPEDAISRIIDITEIHTSYGVDALAANFGLITWVNSRPSSRLYSTSTSASQSMTWNEPKEIHGSSDPAQFGVRTSENEMDGNIVSDNKSSLSENEHSMHDDEARNSESDSYAEILKRKTDDEHCSKEDDKLYLSTTMSSSSSDNVSNSGVQITIPVKPKDDDHKRSQLNHLVQDLVMIAKTAFNLHANKRGWIKTKAFKESIMFESDTRNRIGRRYTPSYNTPLDGNIALAKETVARHSVNDIQQWMAEANNEHESYCFLNAKAFKLSESPVNEPKLEEDLIRYFTETLNHYRVGKETVGSKITLVDAVAYELTKHGHSSTFAWINNQSRSLNLRVQPTRERHHSPKLGSDSQRKREPYPPVDQRLLDFISTDLQIVVIKSIEAAGTDVPRMKDGMKLSSFIFKLTSEFLLRNKGWHNENSFTSPQHLTKLEELTGLQTRPSESIFTFNILKNVLNDFRTRYKAKNNKKVPS